MAKPLRLREVLLLLCIVLLSMLLAMNIAFRGTPPKSLPEEKDGETAQSPTPCPSCPPQKECEAAEIVDKNINAVGNVKPPYVLRINVFTYNRIEGLKRLLKSLVNSYYPHVDPASGQLPMTIYFDRAKKGVDLDETREFLDTFHWPYGPLVIHRREKNIGLRGNILESWYPTPNGGKIEDLKEYTAFFEDDIEVSPYWFVWADQGIRTYSTAFVGETEINTKMLGLSLYRCIKDELSGRVPKFPDNEPFLLQQPSSWGAVYFPKHWRAFRQWFQDLPSDFNVNVEDPRDPSISPSSNTWPSATSWKKYLIHLMYARGLYMLYPNLPSRTVLSTSHLMKGVHPTPQRSLFELPIFPPEDLAPPEDVAIDPNDPLARSPVLAKILMKFPPLEDLVAYDVMHAQRGKGPLVIPNHNAKTDRRYG